MYKTMSLSDTPVDCITVILGFLSAVDRRNAAITCTDMLAVLPKFDPTIEELERSCTGSTVRVSTTTVNITLTYFINVGFGDMLCSVAAGQDLEDVRMSELFTAPTTQHEVFCGNFACGSDVKAYYIEKFAAAMITPRILRKMYNFAL